jgi:hypothetical protein
MGEKRDRSGKGLRGKSIFYQGDYNKLLHNGTNR